MFGKRWLLIFGAIDLITFLFLVVLDLNAGMTPFFSHAVEARASWNSFFADTQLIYFDILVFIPVLILVSTGFSGLLLLLRKRLGVIISLVQAPFRLLLLAKPTLFILSYASYQSDLVPVVISFIVVYGFDFLKTIILIKILKSSELR